MIAGIGDGITDRSMSLVSDRCKQGGSLLTDNGEVIEVYLKMSTARFIIRSANQKYTSWLTDYLDKCKPADKSPT